MNNRRVTKTIERPTLKPPATIQERSRQEGLVEVVNTNRGRDQNIGWGVYRNGKVYIVGTTERHALLNLAQGHKVLNIPRQ